MTMQARSLTAAALLILAAACATTWTVDKYEAPEAGLANRRTYAWKGGEIGLPNEVDPALLARADKAVRVAVEGELARKGYRPTEAGSADMLVSYQVAGQRRFVISNDKPVGASAATEAMTPGRSPAPPSSSQLPREQTVRDGTVIVFIDDPATKRLIWRGLINAETRVATNEGAIEQAAGMARQIASELPPRGP
jgi:Domain of unknown function (DUF4136)